MPHRRPPIWSKLFTDRAFEMSPPQKRTCHAILPQKNRIKIPAEAFPVGDESHETWLSPYVYRYDFTLLLRKKKRQPLANISMACYVVNAIFSDRLQILDTKQWEPLFRDLRGDEPLKELKNKWILYLISLTTINIYIVRSVDPERCSDGNDWSIYTTSMYHTKQRNDGSYAKVTQQREWTFIMPKVANK